MLIGLRRMLYQRGLLARHHAGIPTIVIGNRSVGGSGKTPLTQALARLLLEQGRRPAIVSRGYPVSPSTPRWVGPDSQAREVGDEPLLHHRRLGIPVCVCADRVAAAQAVRARHPEVDILLADDALQHERLARDLEIELVSAARGLGNRRLLPAGPLREPPRPLLPGSMLISVLEPEAEPEAPQTYWVRKRLGTPWQLIDRSPGDFANLAQGRAAILTAIAHPQAFAAALARQGVRGELHAFPDHHAFTASDLDGVRHAECVFVTEKDAVKLQGLADERFWVVPLDIEMPEFTRAKLLSLLTHLPTAHP